MRRRLHALGVDLTEDVEVVEDGRQLLLELGDVRLREADARQAGDVQNLLAGQRHEASVASHGAWVTARRGRRQRRWASRASGYAKIPFT